MDSQTEHPLIDGLFQCLPPTGSNWAPEDRAKWLRAAASITGLVYQRPVDEPIAAEIAVLVLPNSEIEPLHPA